MCWVQKIQTPAVRGVNPYSGHKSIVKDCRENCNKSIVKDGREEHTDGLFGKLKRERAELRDGIPGKIEKVVTDEQKKVENVETQRG